MPPPYLILSLSAPKLQQRITALAFFSRAAAMPCLESRTGRRFPAIVVQRFKRAQERDNNRIALALDAAVMLSASVLFSPLFSWVCVLRLSPSFCLGRGLFSWRKIAWEALMLPLAGESS